MIKDILAPLDLGEMSIAQMRQHVTSYSNGGSSRDPLTDAVISLIQDRLDPFSAQKSGVICAGFNNSVDDALTKYDVGKMDSQQIQELFQKFSPEQVFQKFGVSILPTLQKLLDRVAAKEITLPETTLKEIRRAVDLAPKRSSRMLGA
jgi:hypothetical protein